VRGGSSGGESQATMFANIVSCGVVFGSGFGVGCVRGFCLVRWVWGFVCSGGVFALKLRLACLEVIGCVGELMRVRIVGLWAFVLDAGVSNKSINQYVNRYVEPELRKGSLLWRRGSTVVDLFICNISDLPTKKPTTVQPPESQETRRNIPLLGDSILFLRVDRVLLVLNMFLFQLGTTLDMVGAAKHGIHFLERNLLSLGDKEPHENRQ
jgi:hypothetical protein